MIAAILSSLFNKMLQPRRSSHQSRNESGSFGTDKMLRESLEKISTIKQLYNLVMSGRTAEDVEKEFRELYRNLEGKLKMFPYA
jgi:hypothetical protein